MRQSKHSSKQSDSSNIEALVLREVEQIHQAQVNWRRHLHQHPEISNEEIKTTEFLTKQVTQLGLQILPIKMETGLLAELRGTKPGPTIAIRTDIDALPITEQTNLPYASKYTGKMHACGHDMHMATILGTATVLSKFREHLNGTVRFIFQPAEEMPPGGARPMIANGALKNVEKIFGLHVDPHVSVGKIGLRDGVAMASVTDFDLIIHGHGGHAARPHLAADAIVAAAEVVDAIQKIVSRDIDPISPVAITFGKIEGGTARNVIADQVKLVGTARSLNSATAKALPKLIKKSAESVCKARGTRLEMNIIAAYPVLSNTPAVNRLYHKNFERLYGKGKIEITEPVLGGEDFACYLEKVPGAMFRLGVGNPKINADQPWHSPKFKVDESALKAGTALLALSALDVLSGQST